MSEKMIRYEPQHDYPTRDLTVRNAHIIPYYVDMAAINAEARHDGFEYIQKMLYQKAQAALEVIDGGSIDTRRTLEAFGQGIATLDVIAMTVNSHYNRGAEVVRQNWRPYVQSVDSSELRLADRMRSWPAMFERTHNVVGKIGAMAHQSDEEIRYRILGAQIAHELHTRTQFL